jgi:large subunit ribosomal protein L6
MGRMGRIARNPVAIPAGVEVDLRDGAIAVRGKQGSLELSVHPGVRIARDGEILTFTPVAGVRDGNAQAGTARALVANMVTGVTEGFERKLLLRGVGYRAQLKGSDTLNLALGFSHPVDFKIPEGVAVETPSLTEVRVTGIDKQRVGQVAANIRALRPPEPYKGKGVRYADEVIVLREAKKKK